VESTCPRELIQHIDRVCSSSSSSENHCNDQLVLIQRKIAASAMNGTLQEGIPGKEDALGVLAIVLACAPYMYVASHETRLIRSRRTFSIVCICVGPIKDVVLNFECLEQPHHVCRFTCKRCSFLDPVQCSPLLVDSIWSRT
jgi:hypothetical protein